jgi:hypothetical protein
MQKISAVLRSFLKFLATEGEIPPGLEEHIESPRQYRGERLPRALPWDDVLRLLRSIDRSTSKGRRDYAMLLLIATYGLRAGEVAHLELDDIAWRDGHIRIPRPKVGTPLLFPLTDEIASHYWIISVTIGPIRSTVDSSCGCENPWARLSQLRSVMRSIPGWHAPEFVFLTSGVRIAFAMPWRCICCANKPR